MLHGKVVIIIGGGGGLGRAHALYLAGKGVRVVVNDVSAEAAGRVATEIEALGGTAKAIAASVTDATGIGAMVESVLAAWGRIDIIAECQLPRWSDRAKGPNLFHHIRTVS